MLLRCIYAAAYCAMLYVQATTQRDGDWHFNPPPTNHYIDHSVLPVIQEDENLTDRMRRANGFAQRPVMGHDEEEFETDLSQVRVVCTMLIVFTGHVCECLHA